MVNRSACKLRQISAGLAFVLVAVLMVAVPGPASAQQSCDVMVIDSFGQGPWFFQFQIRNSSAEQTDFEFLIPSANYELTNLQFNGSGQSLELVQTPNGDGTWDITLTGTVPGFQSVGGQQPNGFNGAITPTSDDPAVSCGGEEPGDDATLKILEPGPNYTVQSGEPVLLRAEGISGTAEIRLDGVPIGTLSASNAEELVDTASLALGQHGLVIESAGQTEAVILTVISVTAPEYADVVPPQVAPLVGEPLRLDGDRGIWVDRTVTDPGDLLNNLKISLGNDQTVVVPLAEGHVFELAPVERLENGTLMFTVLIPGTSEEVGYGTLSPEGFLDVRDARNGLGWSVFGEEAGTLRILGAIDISEVEEDANDDGPPVPIPPTDILSEFEADDPALEQADEQIVFTPPTAGGFQPLQVAGRALLDVAVIYERAADQTGDGGERRELIFINQLNASAVRSNANLRFRLVGYAVSDQNAVNNGTDDLEAEIAAGAADLDNGRDTLAADFEVLRRSSGADVMAIVTNNNFTFTRRDGTTGSAVGFAFGRPGRDGEGITAINAGRVETETATPMHEVGHLLSASHANDDNFPPGRGWAWRPPPLVFGPDVIEQPPVRTGLGRRLDFDQDGAMDFPTTAAGDNDFGPRVEYWSNPDVLLRGQRTGNRDTTPADGADTNYNNVANINQNAPAIGNIQEGFFCPADGFGHEPLLNRYFNGLMGRNLDRSIQAEADLLEAFENGEFTPVDLVRGLYQGDLDRADGTPVADYSQQGRTIVKIYRGILDRYPERGGYKFWLDELNRGVTARRIADFFTSSEEFQIVYGDTTDDDFVELLYQNLLGRASDPSGKQFWLDQLNAGTNSRGGVMLDFLLSAEKSNIDTLNGFEGREMFNILTRLGIGAFGNTFDDSYSLNQAAARNNYGRTPTEQVAVYMTRGQRRRCGPGAT